MNKKKIKLTILSTLFAFNLFGCSHSETSKVLEVTAYDNVESLDDGIYYVCHNDIYYEPYFGQTTFRPSKSVDSSSTSRIAWYGDDYEKIPTVYKGDSIALHSTQSFNSQLVIERFEDLGYTIGICQLKQSDSSRYYFSTSTEDFCVDVKSDAGQICQLGEETAVLETIGGVELRAGNVSEAGTVIGLSKGKFYDCDIYIGTDLNEYQLCADVRAFCSTELFSLSEYSYDRNKTITFNFPDNLQSGYYNIAGCGLVRYINAPNKEFSESMDMNIPNDIDNLFSKQTNDNSIVDLEDYAEDVREETFELDEDSNITISVTYQNSSNYADAPIAKIVSDEAVYTLDDEGNNELGTDLSLKKGIYKIKITGLGNRTYSYRIIKNDIEDSTNLEQQDEHIDDTPTGESIADMLKKEEEKANGN